MAADDELDTYALLKLGTITMDNASNNDTFMSELKELLRADNIPFDEDGNRIR